MILSIPNCFCIFFAWKRKAKLPTLSTALTFAPCLNNKSTTRSRPYHEARWRGVNKNLSLWSTSLPSARRLFTKCQSPLIDARCREDLQALIPFALSCGCNPALTVEADFLHRGQMLRSWLLTKEFSCSPAGELDFNSVTGSSGLCSTSGDVSGEGPSLGRWDL